MRAGCFAGNCVFCLSEEEDGHPDEDILPAFM
jgi:hypothetical protein